MTLRSSMDWATSIGDGDWKMMSFICVWSKVALYWWDLKILPRKITTLGTNFQNFKITNKLIFKNLRHVHDSKRRVRDQHKCYDQKTATRKRDKVTGLKDVSYRIHSISSLEIDSSPATLISVLLHCNKTLTPWCSCP